jgi:O-antigen biosynthesis protein
MSIWPVKCEIRPLANIKIMNAEAGEALWVSESVDPQCEILRATEVGRAIAPGWYEIKANIVVVSGVIVSPALYPDYGYGYTEDDKIALPEPDAMGEVSALVLLRSDVCNLRFDPTNGIASFRIGRISVRQVGRLRAALFIVKKISEKQSSGNPIAERLRGLYSLVKNAIKYGRRTAGEIAYREYSLITLAGEGDYQAWLKKYDSTFQYSDISNAARVSALVRRPTFSLLMPVYNTSEVWLRQCIDSVIDQAYSDWELCIADDASTLSSVRTILDEYAALDIRVKVVYRKLNGHISSASNSALDIATGEFCVLLDHDDLLPRHALLEVAEAVVRNPDWKIIYTDEDKIDEAGRRYSPYFKPDWNYDLFLAQNCISHLGVYATELLRQIGGFRTGMEGSQDWDLALRCIECVSAQQIGHIPKVLYHWRAIPGSTALGVGQKNYAHTAAMLAIQSHLDRKREGASALEIEGQPGRFRVQYKLPAELPLVSLIIPTREKIELLRCCIDSIIDRSTYRNYEILVIDNGSKEPESLEYFNLLNKISRVQVISYPAAFNYSAINNFAVLRASGSVLGFVNNDIEVISPGWLEEMVSHALRQDIGAVGAKLYYPNDTIQHAGVILGLGGIAGHIYAGISRASQGQMGRALLTQEMSAVTAACLLVRRDVFNEVLGFDEKLRVAFNDVDFCLRIKKAGYRNLWTPYAELYHHESASRGYEDTPEKIERFQSEIDLMRERWSLLLSRDPAYNVNLPLMNDGSTFAFPPRHQ